MNVTMAIAVGAPSLAASGLDIRVLQVVTALALPSILYE